MSYKKLPQRRTTSCYDSSHDVLSCWPSPPSWCAGALQVLVCVSISSGLLPEELRAPHTRAPGAGGGQPT